MSGLWISRMAATAMLGVGVMIAGSSVAEACTARFTCNPGVSPTCWFRLFYRNGQTSVVTVPAGGQRRIFGLTPGDGYCSSNRGVPSIGCTTTRIRMAC